MSTSVIQQNKFPKTPFSRGDVPCIAEVGPKPPSDPPPPPINCENDEPNSGAKKNGTPKIVVAPVCQSYFLCLFVEGTPRLNSPLASLLDDSLH